MAGINRRTFLRGATALGATSLLGGIEKIILAPRKTFAQMPHTTRLTGKDFIHALYDNNPSKINDALQEEKAYAQVTESDMPFTCSGFESQQLPVPYTPEELLASATSGTPIVQEYSLRTGQLSITDIAQRLASSDEYLQFVEGVNFNAINNGNQLKDWLLGMASSDADRIYMNGTADIANRILLKNFLSPKVRTIKLMINQMTDIAFIYDGATQITASDLNTGQSLGNVNQLFRDIFGFLPVDMISANAINQNSSPEDDVLLLKKYDGTWMGYAWNNISQGTVVDLESLVADSSYAAPTSFGALNLGNDIDSLYIVRFPRQGTVSDVQAAQDIINIWPYSKNYPLGKWDMPVPVFVHPSVDKRNVEDALKYWYTKTGINYVLIEEDIKPRIIVKVGDTGGGAAAGGINEIYPNYRPKSGYVHVMPKFASYDPEYAIIYRHEIGHAFGYLGHTTDGSLMDPHGKGRELTQRDINMMRLLYFKVPRGAKLQSNGVWNVVL